MERGYFSEAFVSFQGEGLLVGRRQLFLRFAGCPLRCRYCDTPESLVRTKNFVVEGREHPNPVSINVLAAEVALLTEDGPVVDGVSLTGGEPLAQSGFLASLLRSVPLPHPRLLETSGTLPSSLGKVIDRIDVVSMDVKLPSNTGETAFWGEHERFLQIAGEKAYVKILVDNSTATGELVRALSLIARTSPATPVFLQPVTPEQGEDTLSFDRISDFFAIARDLVGDVRVVPQTHKMLNYR